MPLPFSPSPGLIVICDFQGLREPEIVKRRPAIVVSPRSRRSGGLCTVVPCSTTAPIPELAHHFPLRIDPPLPNPYPEPELWVKCDMIYTVSLERLNLPWTKNENGKRQYVQQYLED